MTLFEIILISLVQGITEIFPISSSAHLILIKEVLGIEQDLTLDIFLHLGSLVGLLIFFREKIKRVTIQTFSEKLDLDFISQITLTTLPIIFAFLILKDQLDSIRNPRTIGFTLAIGGILLIATNHVQGRIKLTKQNSFYLGLFQALSIIPGVSRSGSLLVGGKVLKTNDKDLYEYIFLAAIPVILGAVLSQLNEVSDLSSPFTLSLGFLVSATASYITLIAFFKIIRKSKALIFFGTYRIILSIIIIISLL